LLKIYTTHYKNYDAVSHSHHHLFTELLVNHANHGDI